MVFCDILRRPHRQKYLIVEKGLVAAFPIQCLLNLNSNFIIRTHSISSLQSLTAICMAMLVDQGLLSYHDKISQHWPEFGQSGKETTTLAELMRHEAGLAAFDTSLQPSDLQTEAIKSNSVGAVVERQSPCFPATGRRQYHAVTRGWVANELFRRVQPQGLTIGEFLREYVSKPLEARVFIGTNDTDYHPVKVATHQHKYGIMEPVKIVIYFSP